MAQPSFHTELPLVTLEVLDQLEEEFEDKSGYRSFVEKYIHLWPTRYRRLAAAVQDSDLHQAIDIALSIRIASSMAGATRLGQLSEDIGTKLRMKDMEAIPVLLAYLRLCGNETMIELQRNYLAGQTPIRSRDKPSGESHRA